MQIVSVTDPRAIDLACAALARGELVIYPTETCYGLAADVKSTGAVTRLLAYKGDRHRQVAIAVASRSMAEKYVQLNELTDNLYHHFLPGPVTVISASRSQTDPRLESVDATLGIRLPGYPFARKLISRFGRPVTATSGNTSGKKEPYSLADWQKYTTGQKQAMISLFLDAGKLRERPTSTVVDTTLNDPAVLRQGELVIPALSPKVITKSPIETAKLGQTIVSRHLALTRRFPLILALQGDLGTGKTHFVKGVAEALNVTLNITSPTYTLLKEYPYQTKKYEGTLYHLDTWRLSDPSELETTLHLSRLLKPGNIVAIEWAGKAQELLQTYEKDYPILVINFKEITGNTRQISYAFSTPEWS